MEEASLKVRGKTIEKKVPETAGASTPVEVTDVDDDLASAEEIEALFEKAMQSLAENQSLKEALEKQK